MYKMELPLLCRTEYSHFPENPLFIPFLQSISSPFWQSTTDRFTVSIVLPFPECHIVKVMQYEPFQIGCST